MCMHVKCKNWYIAAQERGTGRWRIDNVSMGGCNGKHRFVARHTRKGKQTGKERGERKTVGKRDGETKDIKRRVEELWLG